MSESLTTLVILVALCSISGAAMPMEEQAGGLAAVQRVQNAFRGLPVEEFSHRYPPQMWIDEAGRLDELRRDAERRLGADRVLAALDAELERMQISSRDPQRLQALIAALGHNPERLRSSLVWPRVAHRIDDLVASDIEPAQTTGMVTVKGVNWQWQVLPLIFDSLMAHTAVWTGSEMIVWGGRADGQALDTGGRYEPATDTWLLTTTAAAPVGRGSHTAVWGDGRMIVWGGSDTSYNYLNSGGRYDPVTDLWSSMSGLGTPSERAYHTAVWTGSEMIVWGGGDSTMPLSSGGRYHAATDTWTAMTTSNEPSGRTDFSAVWTGNVMIVWGGGTSYSWPPNMTATGGRYDPVADSWTDTSTDGAPSARYAHVGVWTGSEMIVWGTQSYGNTGGRYDPDLDQWTATDVTTAPEGRAYPSVVWTGHEMIVWGGSVLEEPGCNTGGHYDPAADTWVATTMAGAPLPSFQQTAVWTGDAMIVWGGNYDNELALYSVPGLVFMDDFESGSTDGWSSVVP